MQRTAQSLTVRAVHLPSRSQRLAQARKQWTMSKEKHFPAEEAGAVEVAGFVCLQQGYLIKIWGESEAAC